MNEPTIEVTAQLWIDAQPGGDTERPLRGSVEIANSSDQRYEITAVRLFFDGRSWEGRAEPTDVSGLWALRDGPERPGRSLVDLEVDLRRSDGEGSVRTVRVAGLTVRIVE